MIIRKAKPDELKRVAELSALAFEFSIERDQSPEEYYKELAEHPQSRADIAALETWCAFQDDDQTLMSAMAFIPYDAYFDGHIVTMAGVGNVSTFPQYRRERGIRRIFEHALPDLYAQGVTFSYLYPFSSVFYRRFGYEVCCETNRAQLRLSRLPNTPTGGCCRLLDRGHNLKDDMLTAYSAWAHKYNLITVNGDPEYLWTSQANPYQTQEYTYVYYSADGTPKGYITMKPSKDPEGQRTLVASRFVFSDLEGFYGLLNLVLSTAANHELVSLPLPMDFPLAAVLPECNFGGIYAHTKYAGMARVVNVEKVLRMTRTRGEGRMTLDIVDEQIAQNQGRFEMTFADGETREVRHIPKPENEDADLSMTIQEFSRLIAGRFDVADFQYLSHVRMNCAPELAEKVFYRKPLYICEPF